MKILIVSYYFYPLNTPRAFRAFELVKEFSRQGNKVTIVIPKSNFDYSIIKNKYNFSIIEVNPGFFLNRKIYFSKTNKTQNKINTFSLNLKRKLKNIIKYIYFDMAITEYAYTLYKELSAIDNRYDLLISIGLPFSTHLGVGLSRNKNDLAHCYIADYGDPFSFNTTSKQPFYIQSIEKYVLKKFDAITIPIDEAKHAFKLFDIEKKIYTIPQGFDFSEIKTLKYIKHKIPKFAYAGNFYTDIRNPKKLLDYLVSFQGEYHFDIYTDLNNSENQICLMNYLDKTKGKIFIRPLIEREECISLLSTYDFLININNISSVQSPSKMIDYALTNRPIFSFNQNNFNIEKFNIFLDRKFNQEDKKTDISKYNIQNIVKQYIQIYKSL